MEQRRVRRLWVWLLAVVALAAVAAIWIFLPPRIRWRQVEEAIRQSETAPSQGAADRLAILLNQGYPTPEQGERILASLFRPQVTTRRTYPAGRCPTVALQLPFSVRRTDTSLVFEESFGTEGESTEPTLQGVGHYLEGAYRLVDLDHRLRDGETCKAQIRYHIGFHAPGRCNPLLRNSIVRAVVRDVVTRFSYTYGARILAPKSKEYECDFAVPVSLIGATEGAEEKIDLVSNSQLDALRSAFVSHSETWMGRRYRTNGGSLYCQGGVTITYPSLPLAVAFKAVLRLPDGQEIPPPYKVAEPLRARAGAAGEFSMNIADFVAPGAAGKTAPWVPGAYTGTLVLRPDPRLAYDDPAIDAIWDGTLEFPIGFTVTAEPKGSNQE
jgi:hypothetical protein